MLSFFIWGPVIAAIMLGIWPRELSVKEVRQAALVAASVMVVASLGLFLGFDLYDTGWQLQEFLPWVEPVGLNYQLGLDGLSLSLVALNALLTWVAIYSTNDQLPRPRLFFCLLLLVNGGIAGAFLAQNLLLFFLFYEVELIPFFLLISIWGGQKREYAAIKFLLYTAVSGILILAGFLGLFWVTDLSSFDYEVLRSHSLPLGTQLALMVTLLIAFGIKLPLIPFHTWLPDAYVESSTPVTILLGGILAKLGAYGLLRFCLGLFPEAWSVAAPTLSLWAAICVLGGALAAIAQKDIKRMVAYSSVGHMGYVLLGSAAATPLSLVGVIAQLVSHGLILAILFQLVGVVEEKAGTRELDVLNGLLNPIRGLPLISALLILGGMASAGIPGLVGFIAEFLVFQGSFAIFPIPTLICVVGTGLTAVYFVILLNRTCFGKLDNGAAYFPKVLWSDRLPAVVLTVLILFLGIQPTWLVRWSEPTATAMSAAVPQLIGHFAPADRLNPQLAQQTSVEAEIEGLIVDPARS